MSLAKRVFLQMLFPTIFFFFQTFIWTHYRLRTIGHIDFFIFICLEIGITYIFILLELCTIWIFIVEKKTRNEK